MKTIKFIAVALLISSCGYGSKIKKVDSKVDALDVRLTDLENASSKLPPSTILNHFFVPHVTVGHTLENTDQLYYSLMTLVKKQTNVWCEQRPDGVLVISTKDSSLGDQLGKWKTAVGSEYVLLIDTLWINSSFMNEKEPLTGSIKVVVDNEGEPDYHTHTHPMELHNGTVHRPLTIEEIKSILE